MSDNEEMHKNNKESNSYDSDVEFEEKEMEKKPVSRHYKNKQEAEKFRRKGDRIYQDKKGYYIRRPQSKKSFWEDFFGI